MSAVQLIAAIGALLLAHAVRGDVVAIVNDIRARGCLDEASFKAPLQRDAALDGAARLVARGADLPQALQQAAYRASSSNMIDIGGRMGFSDLSHTDSTFGLWLLAAVRI